MIPKLKLPGSTKSIELREANVEDAMDFSEIDPRYEEQAITAFIDRLQVGTEKVLAAEMTGDQRQVVMMWYWLHTLVDKMMPIEYDCPKCKKEHAVLVDMTAVVTKYQDPDPSKLAVKTELYGKKFTILPLTGSDLMDIEKLSATFPDKPNRVNISRIAKSIHFDPVEGKKPEELEIERDNWIGALNYRTEFMPLVVVVANAMIEMSHGVETERDDLGRSGILTPPQTCPTKGGATRIRVPFRPADVVTRF